MNQDHLNLTYQDEHIVLNSQKLIVGNQVYPLAHIHTYTLKPDLALIGCSGFFLIPLSVLFLSGGIMGQVFGCSLILISIFFLLGSRRHIMSVTIDSKKRDESSTTIQTDILVGQLNYLKPIAQVFEQLGIHEKPAIMDEKR